MIDEMNFGSDTCYSKNHCFGNTGPRLKSPTDLHGGFALFEGQLLTCAEVPAVPKLGHSLSLVS